MTNEEEILRNIAPKENPFRVPDGYFDSLPDTVMLRIHAEEQKKHSASRWHRWAIAASFVGLISVASTVLYNTHAGTTETEVAKNTNTVNDDALDYAMVDNSEIEYYLTTE